MSAPGNATNKFTAGQPVRLADHDPVIGPDAKPVPFYDFYRNLTGTVAKVFDDGTISVSIDRESLPKESRRRHEDCESRDRDKWLDKLADEERNRLTAAQKAFRYRYTLLVAAHDLQPAAPAGSKPIPSPSARPKGGEQAKATSPPEKIDLAVPRKSSSELAAEEERHLQEILKRTKET